MKKTYKCPCKKKEHTINLDKKHWQYFADIVTEMGENQNIHYLGNGKTYIVPRIFVAMHGLKGVDLPLLGFKEAMEW